MGAVNVSVFHISQMHSSAPQTGFARAQRIEAGTMAVESVAAFPDETTPDPQKAGRDWNTCANGSLEK